MILILKNLPDDKFIIFKDWMSDILQIYFTRTDKQRLFTTTGQRDGLRIPGYGLVWDGISSR